MRAQILILTLLFYPASTLAQHKVGVVYGFSGAAAFWSAEGRKGLELAAEELPEITLIYEDNQTNPTKSATAFKKLVERDKVSAVIGSVWDFLTKPMIPLANRTGTLLISPTMMPEKQSAAQSFYTLGAPFWLLDSGIETFFQLNREVRTFAIICWDDGWGHGWREALRRVSERGQIKIVAEACTIDFTTDLRSEVSKVLLAKPDAVFIPHLYQSAMRRLKEQRYTGKILATGNIREDLHEKRLSSEDVEGVYFLDWPSSGEFRNRFKSRYGYEPVVEAQRHYDALHAVARALRGKLTPAESIRAVKFSGASGEIDFSLGTAASKSEAELFQFDRLGSVRQISGE
jgi:branched-chain amino acid transport system substrate-binding protein